VTSGDKPRKGRSIIDFIGDIVVGLTGMDCISWSRKLKYVPDGVNFINHNFSLSFLAPAGQNLVNIGSQNSNLCPLGPLAPADHILINFVNHYSNLCPPWQQLTTF
jgi:hypothetical protein